MKIQEMNAESNEMINIQFTVKEVMALTGIRFNGNPEISVDAKKKLKKSLDKKFNL
jgi:hypothetical protein